MPTHQTRYSGQLYSQNGKYYHFKIYDKNYTSSNVIPVKIGSGGIQIKYDTSGQKKFSSIIASKCSISLVVENSVFGTHLENFIKNLRETYEEGDATIVIWNTGGTSAPPLWSGNILIDLSVKEDVSKPYEVELNATDGIGLLKNYDMVSTQGSEPYAAADTYISDGYQTYIYWIKTILEYCNTPDSDSTDGDVGDYDFSTSIDWWYEDHPTPSTAISPLAYTKCKMAGAYTLQDNGLYKVKNVYDVLESFCKQWGMRVVFWKNRFYFTQIELYKTAESGTIANPDNVDSQIWNRNGSFNTSRDYLGEIQYTAYSQDIETNLAGFDGGLQKLSGSTWDFYPKLKEVTVDFESISNNNYFQYFPQPTTSTTQFYELITSSPLGVHSGASSFSGFNMSIVLDYNNTGASLGVTQAIPSLINFSVRARPDGDTNWDNGYYLDFTTASAPTWESYPSGASFPNGWNTKFTSSYGAQTWWGYFDSPNPIFFSCPQGSSQQTIFSGYIPSAAYFTGDWEFELFTLGTIGMMTPSSSPSTIYFGHHGLDFNNLGTMNPFGAALPNLTSVGITYADVLDANGQPVSQFNPILTNVVGGSLNTTVYSSRSETQQQKVENIWWGDTLTNGEPASLMWIDDVGGTGYTDPNGLWRNGQTGSFNKTLAELLCEAQLFNQQQADNKWSLTTAVSETNSWKADASGSRPVYINPIGKIHDTIDGIFYYMLRGTFNVGNDEWDGEWVQISYDNSISTTTTTTSTGGNIPSDNTASARLAAPSDLGNPNPLNLARLSNRIAGGATVTSLSIDRMNPLTDDDNYLYPQNTIIKAGDVFDVCSNGRFIQFTASADVSNTATSISVVSQDIMGSLGEGSQIRLSIRDSFQQINHKTRGTIHIPQYSLSESSSDPADPSEGNAVIWMSDGTASGNDGDIIAKIKAGGVLKRFNIVDFGAFTNTYSIDFDGVDDYIDVSGAATDINEDLGSVSLWVQLDTVSSSVTSWQAAADTNNFIRVWYKDSDSTLRFQTKRGGTNNVTNYAGGIEADGNWHHLAMTWDSSANQIKGYLDGVAVGGTGTAAGSFSGSLSIVNIGKQATASAAYWKGNIDEVGIWSSVLTAAEITEIYNNGNPLSLLKDSGDYSSSGDLIGWWRMGDGATYPTIPDDSTNSYPQKLSNYIYERFMWDGRGKTRKF